MTLDSPLALALTCGYATARLHADVDAWADEQHLLIAARAARARRDLDERVDYARLVVAYPAFFDTSAASVEEFIAQRSRETARLLREIHDSIGRFFDDNSPAWPDLGGATP